MIGKSMHLGLWYDLEMRKEFTNLRGRGFFFAVDVLLCCVVMQSGQPECIQSACVTMSLAVFPFRLELHKT